MSARGQARPITWVGHSRAQAATWNITARPLAIAEANAFGVPALVPRVGGVATVLREGVNGGLLEAAAPSEAYATRVQALFSDMQAYRDLARSARAVYDTTLNWRVAAQRVQRLVEETR